MHIYMHMYKDYIPYITVRIPMATDNYELLNGKYHGWQ